MEIPSLLFQDQKTVKKRGTTNIFKRINKSDPYKRTTKREVSAGNSEAGEVKFTNFVF